MFNLVPAPTYMSIITFLRPFGFLHPLGCLLPFNIAQSPIWRLMFWH
jgi:hypothetical protein